MIILNIKKRSLHHLSKLFLSLIALSISINAYSELEVLDDKKLDEQTGKAGITIDLAFKLSIGEIYIDYLDREQKENKNILLTPLPPRIEYQVDKN